MVNCGLIFLLFSGGFGAFRDRYPDWCEGSQSCSDGPNESDTNEGDLMGLRSLRISTPVPPPSSTTSNSTTNYKSNKSNSTDYSNCDSAVVTTCDYLGWYFI